MEELTAIIVVVGLEAPTALPDTTLVYPLVELIDATGVCANPLVCIEELLPIALVVYTLIDPLYGEA